jgi:hypothetical protein
VDRAAESVLEVVPHEPFWGTQEVAQGRVAVQRLSRQRRCKHRVAESAQLAEQRIDRLGTLGGCGSQLPLQALDVPLEIEQISQLARESGQLVVKVAQGVAQTLGVDGELGLALMH